MGAALGGLAMWGFTVVIRNPRATDLIGLAAGFGAVTGAVLAPLAAWTLMRHVPLWRAILETTLGAALGATAGFALVPRFGYGVLWPIGLALAGFTAAALRLRLTHRGATPAGAGRDVSSL